MKISLARRRPGASSRRGSCSSPNLVVEHVLAVLPRLVYVVREALEILIRGEIGVPVVASHLGRL